jgi:hypothetical protein
MEISKSHTSFFLGVAQFSPCIPVHFIVVVIMPPPKFGNSIHHSFTHTFRNLEYRHCITGIACATTLMGVSFPPIDKCFSFQPLMRCIILSIKCSKVSLIYPPHESGKAKVLSERVSVSICRHSQISTLVSTCMFGEKKILDLAKLTNYPELAQ